MASIEGLPPSVAFQQKRGRYILYVLDKPTTGLHPIVIGRLMLLLQDAG
ncbi:hypothetical protein [Gluconobacter kanchanaburiensis]|nr:hypothetical protein [Gluconobacter kanchanaburiensis]MBF0862664.1 hypothetical protein [Gluconobacter kanchanaburiensis]